MSYRRRRQRRVENTTFTLNITSMTDMFTMLLCFLLQTYATGELVQPEAGIRLPLSSSMKDPTKAPQVVVTPKEVKLDNQVIMTLNDGVPAKSDLDPRNPQVIRPLFEALHAKLAADAEHDAVLLQADSSKDMAALSTYLVTISAAGYAKVKLATVVGQ